MTMSEVYINNKLSGEIDNPQEFVQQFREERRRSAISHNANIFLHAITQDVYIETMKGRARRPLIVVRDGRSMLTSDQVSKLERKELIWNDLISKGIVEYLDAAEEENSLVAFTEDDLTPEHTHLEISPLGMLGLCAALVPYGNFNQSTRLNAGAKNQKQAVGFYAANFSVRMDMDVSIMHYPQMPLVQTLMHDIWDYGKHAAGQNVIVAIMSYKGYNMEDAIIINRGSLDKGLGRSTYFRPSTAEELRYAGGLVDEVSIPDKDVKGFKSDKDYRFLEDDGIIFPEAKVTEGDVIIGKTSPPRFLSSLDEYSIASSTRRESSSSLSHGEEGIIDFVLVTENEEGNKLVQVRVRDSRTPEIGDKFTSRHGQKGVVGLIVPPEDMPFSSVGTVPDVIFSPHGIPSRMTISHLIEMLGGKVGALSGRFINGTTFDAEPEEALRKELLSLGFRENGTEVFYHGETGERFPAKIYVGNMFYLKLKHMVANKMHSRARGPIQLLTRQPTEGRAKEGGLRLGEMEKDTFVAHGASLLLKERFDSDKSILPISEESGVIAIVDEYKKKSYCPLSSENAVISYVEMSYAFKLLLDEFKSLGIYPKLILESKY
ncbi:MAG: DNA-directed RNA polymerase subunit B [Nanoarchaeota archaeon]|nr:DNA-directed RNA polymerase subunit B [Nanoarchaeota archaeon]